MYSREDTIYAFATGMVRAGVAVLRLSGSAAVAAIEHFTSAPAPRPRQMVVRDLSYEGERLDRALVVYFSAPHSWTGEDIAEFHIHGGQAVKAGLLAACSGMGLRLAEAGEFSRRAFEHGKADLAELEGLADLVAAETEAQRRQALRQMTGAASAIYEGWREVLLSSLAEAEAMLDFPEDVEGALGFLPKLDRVHGEIAAHLDDHRLGERLREGVHIALVGGANVGKSTLLNLLAGRAAAIVSPHAGTTRDIVEVALDVSGYPIIISDLAGLRPSTNAIEAEGVRRAEERIASADLRVIMLAADIPAEQNARALSHRREGDLILVNKIDVSREIVCADADLHLSLIKEGDCVEDLTKALTERVAGLCGAGESLLITRARHREALADCAAALARAQTIATPELIAEDLRLALTALGRITGRSGVEDMLDALFAQFCIGK